MKIRFTIICFIGNLFFTFLFLYSFSSDFHENDNLTKDTWIMVNTDNNSDDELFLNKDILKISNLENENGKRLATVITESLEKEKQEDYEEELQKYRRAREQLSMRYFAFTEEKCAKYRIKGVNDRCEILVDNLKKKQELLSIIAKFKQKYPKNTTIEKIKNFEKLPSPTQQEQKKEGKLLKELAINLNIATDGQSLRNVLIKQEIITSCLNMGQKNPIKNTLKRIASENNVLNRKKSEKKESKLSKSQDLNERCYDTVFTVIPIEYNHIDRVNKEKSFNPFLSNLFNQFITFLPHVKNITVNFSLKNALGCLFKRKEQ